MLTLTAVPDNTEALPQIVEMEFENYVISVSPDDTGVLMVNATIRSPSNQNMMYSIETDLGNGPFWTVEHLDSIMIEPLGEWNLQIRIIAPAGEEAGKEVELEVKVSAETGVATGSDECTIRVLPYFLAEIEPQADYMIDVEAQGSFAVYLRNRGNIRAPVGLDLDGDILTYSGPVILEPGQRKLVYLDCDLSSFVSEDDLEISSFSEGFAGNDLVLKVIPDGDLFHLMFKRGPFLILLPGIGDQDSVKVMALGGDITDVEILLDGETDEIEVRTDPDIDVPSLQRIDLNLEGRGFKGKDLLTLKAIGYHNGIEIVSQPLPVMVSGRVVSRDSIPTTTYIYAGGGASTVGAVLIGSFGYFYSASEVFRYKWLLIAFIPLYSTVHNEKVLDHFFRGRLFEFIKENPGVTFTALKEHFEVTNGTLTYHLHKLEKEELIVHRNLGKYKLFYADGIRIKGVEAVISPVDRDIISLIKENPGISSRAIISFLVTDRSQRTISRHLKQLERNGFIDSERRDGKRIFFLAGDIERVLMPKRGVVSVSEMTGADY